MTTMTEQTNGERLWERHLEKIQRAHERGDHTAETILRSQSQTIAEKVREIDAEDETMRRFASGDR